MCLRADARYMGGCLRNVVPRCKGYPGSARLRPLDRARPPGTLMPHSLTAGTGHFLRSAEMEYVSLIMAEHLAHDVVGRLGEIGTLQFTDMNGDLTAFKRYYTPYIRRCDELEKKLKFFEVRRPRDTGGTSAGAGGAECWRGRERSRLGSPCSGSSASCSWRLAGPAAASRRRAATASSCAQVSLHSCARLPAAPPAHTGPLRYTPHAAHPCP